MQQTKIIYTVSSEVSRLAILCPTLGLKLRLITISNASAFCLFISLLFTSLHLLIRRATMSWIIPRLFPSVDIDLLRVSMASWLVLPNRDSPFTAIS